MMTVVGIAFTLCLIIGVPIAFAMGFASIIGLVAGSDLSLQIIPQRMFTGLDSFTLLAIPLFVLAGQVMEVGGISRRLVNFTTSIVGHIRGGLGISTVFTSVIFAGVSGSAAADTAAVGSIMAPAMNERKYPKGLTASLLAAGGSLGPIIPPSLTMILYAVITNTSIVGLFLAGVVPGLLMGLFLMLLVYYYGRKYNLREDANFSFKVVRKTTLEAFWALLMPLVIIGGILTGYFTATEAGVIAVVYALIVSIFIYKEIKIKDLPKILVEAASTNAMIGLIIAGAAILGWIVAYVNLPRTIIEILTALTENRILLLLLLVLFLILIGCFIETIALAIIVAPILGPLVITLGFDPIHFGFIVVASLVFAGLTPPVGAILNIAIGITRGKFKDTLPFIMPFFLVMLSVVILTILIPELATFIPNLVLQ